VVIVPYLERYDLDDNGAVNRLYVALTRARRKLVLLEDVARPASVFDTVWWRYEDSLSSLCADVAPAP
jgi:superfamily I DNA and/or RNA helicase